MTELNINNYKTSVEKGTVLVDAWAPWCTQCPRMSSILDQTEPDFNGKITFAKLNVSENMELGQALGVTSLPTLFLYKDGKLVGQKTGIITKPILSAWLNQ